MKKVILMLVDALSSEYLTKENMPHLYAYAQENVHVQEINPNFGFCERTEVFTGMKPRNSGNFTAIGYNPEKGMYRKETLLLRLFSYAEKVSYINARRGLNLYARFAGKRMRPYLIPLNMLNKFFLTEDEKNHEEVNAFVGESVFDVMTERDLKYTLEAFTALGRESRLKNDRERLDCVIRLLNKEYSFIPLYISAADAMGHICREDALGMQNMLKQVDGYVKELIDLTAEN